MLTLLLTPTDGGTGWRHTLATGEARAGWECTGPLGLAQRIGRVLGHAPRLATPPERVAAFASRLARLDDGRRCYSASRAADPFGVASFLLSLRDLLRLAGWRGEPLGGSARLGDLVALEALDVPPFPVGPPDLFQDLSTLVHETRELPCRLTIDLAAPREGYTPAVRELLGGLVGAGARLSEVAPDVAVAPPATDLGKLQRALLDRGSQPAELSGDGSFLLLEADTPIEAGELAAAVLRNWPLADSTALVATDASALDAALARQGGPTLGLSSSSSLRPESQFLPLRLALAFRPRDPMRAAELLSLPGGPLPGHVRHRLLDALAEMPGVDSPAWQEAVDELVQEAERPSETSSVVGSSLRRSIDDWFGGEHFDPRSGIAASKAAALSGMVGEWAGARAAISRTDGDDLSAALWSHAAAVARNLAGLLSALPGSESIAQRGLAQLHDVAAGMGSEVAPFAPEAGRPAVCRSPSGVLPGPRAVLWFGFVEGRGEEAVLEPWTASERAALVAAGLHLAEPGATRAFEAWSWRRPLLVARERVALVRWRLDGTEPVGPHPLTDELGTRLAPSALEACTVRSAALLAGRAAPLSAALSKLVPATPIVPRSVWTVAPDTLEPHGPLSATSLENLLGCPFQWALERQARLRRGRGVDLPSDSRLLGDFAHRLLQDMLLGSGALDLSRATPEEAAAWVLRAFDARVEAEAAPLVRAGSEVECDSARSLVAGAAAALLRLLKAGRWLPRAAEAEVTGTFAGQPVHGFVDLVLERDGEPALLDLKLSGRKYRRAELEQGTGLQIALYASMLRPGPELPASGFFILSEGELLTLDSRAFPGATPVPGPSARETLLAAEKSFVAWRRVLSKGILPLCADDLPWAPAVADAGGPAPEEAMSAWRDAACRFCRFTTICRARVGEEGAP
jgi:ATP-dependent helicase/nuclease subunit B